MQRSGWYVVSELNDDGRDPAPRGRGVVIAFGCELVGARGALLECLLPVALEHQGGGAPDVDLGYHAVSAKEEAKYACRLHAVAH
jgi:hypothetical protein